MRERTYYAQLCLVQLAADGHALCADPLALPSLEALRPLMAATETCKILHAARQDLEVLAPAVGTLRNLFDTQVAAALVGFPAQVGYADLLRDSLDVDLHKSQTRTDWSRRPLSAAQIEYALDDVRHLPKLRAWLGERLERLGRRAWLDEEMANIGGESLAPVNLPYQASVSACDASSTSSVPGVPMAAEVNCAICAASPLRKANR